MRSAGLRPRPLACALEAADARSPTHTRFAQSESFGSWRLPWPKPFPLPIGREALTQSRCSHDRPIGSVTRAGQGAGVQGLRGAGESRGLGKGACAALGVCGDLERNGACRVSAQQAFRQQVRSELEYAPKATPNANLRGFDGLPGFVCATCVARLCARGFGSTLKPLSPVYHDDTTQLRACCGCGERAPEPRLEAR